MKKFVWVFCLMVVGVFVAAQNAAAQGTAASIRGTVVDPSGALVANASLTAIQTETGLTREVSSDSRLAGDRKVNAPERIGLAVMRVLLLRARNHGCAQAESCKSLSVRH